MTRKHRTNFDLERRGRHRCALPPEMRAQQGFVWTGASAR
jgi:hypothetical protein